MCSCVDTTVSCVFLPPVSGQLFVCVQISRRCVTTRGIVTSNVRSACVSRRFINWDGILSKRHLQTGGNDLRSFFFLFCYLSLFLPFSSGYLAERASRLNTTICSSSLCKLEHAKEYAQRVSRSLHEAFPKDPHVELNNFISSFVLPIALRTFIWPEAKDWPIVLTVRKQLTYILSSRCFAFHGIAERCLVAISSPPCCFIVRCKAEIGQCVSTEQRFIR